MEIIKKYICKYCNKIYDSPYKLGGHITRCKLNPNYEIHLKKLEEARKHINYKNRKINESNICYCQFCNKECKNLNSLKQHEIRCKENPNKIDLTYLSNRDYSNFNFNPSNQFIKAQKEGKKFEVSSETKEKLSKIWKGKDLPEEMKIKISNGMQKAVKEHPESYFGINTNTRVKKYLYNGVWLDGNWEVIFAKYLDSQNIKWNRPKQGFKYIWNNGNHIYYPDFYLIDYDLYIEIKGQETERDHIKWKSVSNLLVIRWDEIKKINRNTFNILEYINNVKQNHLV